MSEETQTRALAPRPAVSAGGHVMAIVPQNLDEAWRLAVAFAESGITPNGVDTPAKVMLVICGGAEVGFGPFQSLQAFAIINKRLCMWGDAVPALLLGNGFKIREWFENESDQFPDNMTAYCEVTRPDGEVKVGKFSVADAKRGKLWNKKGRDGQDTPWVTFPRRMLQMRARGFGARDGAPDVLRGIAIREEVEDVEVVSDVTASAPQPLHADGPKKAEAPKAPEAPQEEPAGAGECPDCGVGPGEAHEPGCPAAEAAAEPEPEEEEPDAEEETEGEAEVDAETQDDEDDETQAELPPEMETCIDALEAATTFEAVKAALRVFLATPLFRGLPNDQANHFRRNAWATIMDGRKAGNMLDLPDHAQDVSAFRLWLEAEEDPDAIKGTFDVLQRNAEYAEKNPVMKEGIEAAVMARLAVLG